MALSDLIRSVLQATQYAGTAVAPLMGNNWQQATQEMQNRAAAQQQAEAQAAQQQFQNQQEQARFGQTQAYQNAEIEDRRQQIFQNYLKTGKVTRADAQAGGPGLNADGASPSIGAGGGQMQPNQPNVPPQIATTQGILNGMQGAPSQTPNAANQSQNAGLAAQRFAGAPTASQGGVVIPAASQTSPTQNIVPTPFQFIGPGGQKYNYTPNSETSDSGFDFNIHPDMQGFYGGKTSIHFDNPKDATQFMDSYSKNRMAFVGAGKSAAKGGEAAGEDTSAAKLTAKSAGLDPDKINKITDLPLDQQESAWNKMAELKASAQDKELKAARLRAEQQKADDLKNQKLGDTEVMKEVIANPNTLFDKNLDKGQAGRVRQQMAAAGYQVPVNELDTKMKDNMASADNIESNLDGMKQIAQKLGPHDFSMLMGKLKNEAGDWGSSAFAANSKQGQLEQEFRALSKRLTAYEAQLFGGGRTAVMMYNMVKTTTPGMGMDVPTLLGNFDAQNLAAQKQKQAVMRYAYGLGNNPYSQTGGHYPGELVYQKGVPYRIKRVNPANGKFFSEPVE